MATMNPRNVLLAIDVITLLAERIAGALAIGADIPDEELDPFVRTDDASRARLAAKIAAKRAGG